MNKIFFQALLIQQNLVLRANLRKIEYFCTIELMVNKKYNNMKKISMIAFLAAVAGTTALAQSDAAFMEWPAYAGDDLELKVDETGTHFTLWSPGAENAEVIIYPTDVNSQPDTVVTMQRAEAGTRL